MKLYFWGQQVEDDGKGLWTTTIVLPIYGQVVALNDKLITAAIKAKVKVLVKTMVGNAVIDPKKWKKTGMRIEKVFKLPEHPMVLWQNRLEILEGGEKKHG